MRRRVFLVTAAVLAIAVGYVLLRTFRLVKQISAEANSLPAEEALAREAGIPLDPEWLQAPLPPPDLNAAPDYEKLIALLEGKELQPPPFRELSRLGTPDEQPGDASAVDDALSERQDLFSLMDQATGKPECVFQRDWKAAAPVPVQKYRVLGDIVWAYSVRAVRLAIDGDFAAAATMQARVFRMAHHIASDPVYFSHHDAFLLYQMGLAGMERILRLGKELSAAASFVRKALAAETGDLGLQWMLKGDLVRDHSRREFWSNPPRGLLSGWKNRVGIWAGDATRAVNLRMTLPFIECAALPYPQRMDAARDLVEGLTRTLDRFDRYDPAISVGQMHLGTMVLKMVPEQVLKARLAVLKAASAILAWKVEQGDYPPALTDLPDTPIDPFNGEALHYRRENEGFVVYSVGEDGKFADAPRYRPLVPEQYFRYP